MGQLIRYKKVWMVCSGLNVLCLDALACELSFVDYVISPSNVAILDTYQFLGLASPPK